MFQLNAAIARVEDPMFKNQLRLTMNVLSAAVTAATESLTPSTVNDVEFALNDVAATVGELTAADADIVSPAVEMLQKDVASLKEAIALPKELIVAVQALKAKLRARQKAIERQTYKEEGSTLEPLPHPPEALRTEALPLREQLSAAGFFTPALDDLINKPESLRFHSLVSILDELDVITGG